MSSEIKIVFVGGGSYAWMPKILNDLILTDEFEGSKVYLLDINIKAAREVADAAEILRKKHSKNFSFVPTTDERTSFAGADFVIITISTGGLDAMAADIEIPEKYNIFQTVGDTVGPGGWARALRNIPVFLDLSRKIEKLSPRATILNYTNPMYALTAVLTRNTALRTVGLCHCFYETDESIRKIFDVESKDISYVVGGINHFHWLLDFTIKGQPGYPLLQEVLDGRRLADTQDDISDDAFGYISGHEIWSELYDIYGLIGYRADRHTAEFFPNYLIDEQNIEKYRLFRSSIADRKEFLKKNREKTLKITNGQHDPGPKSQEAAVDIMKAVAFNENYVDVANMPNIGQIDNLPRGAIVETMAVFNAHGPNPLSSGSMPQELLAMTMPHIFSLEEAIEASLTHDRKRALAALRLSPLCSHLTKEQVFAMGNELLEANIKYTDYLG